MSPEERIAPMLSTERNFVRSGDYLDLHEGDLVKVQIGNFVDTDWRQLYRPAPWVHYLYIDRDSMGTMPLINTRYGGVIDNVTIIGHISRKV